ncbi:hypothetical protein OIV19_19025 [Brucella sp. HL-2]|nr:hypothetical protein [Brucella sp. HL-2]MCV9909696.1 hypothetical protein [Brucella sp. HL-2]
MTIPFDKYLTEDQMREIAVEEWRKMCREAARWNGLSASMLHQWRNCSILQSIFPISDLPLSVCSMSGS